MDQVRNVKCLSPKFPLVLLILNPETFGLESHAIEEDEVALPVLLGSVAEGGDHDIAICQAVSGVRGSHSQSVHLPRLDDLGTDELPLGVGEWTRKEKSHLVQLWVEGVGLDVDNVDSVRPEGRNDQPLS